MSYEYYIISFKNDKTGEFKEYYQFISPEDIEEKAKYLRNEFFGEDENITIYIYKLEKTIKYDE